MTVYVISQMTIHDRDEYAKYEDQFADVFAKFDGKMLSVDDAPMSLGGEWTANRSVLIEFPSKQSALSWLTSPAYVEISKHRMAASTANAILVEGGLGPFGDEA